jgi:hypothetical protein
MFVDLDAVTPDDDRPNRPSRGKAELFIPCKLTPDARETCL